MWCRQCDKNGITQVNNIRTNKQNTIGLLLQTDDSNVDNGNNGHDARKAAACMVSAGQANEEICHEEELSRPSFVTLDTRQYAGADHYPAS
jgi:copper chaperone CopZ